MEALELLEILSRGEDSRHKFKRDFTNAEQLAAEMAAFANTAGGQIFIGAEDDGTLSSLGTVPASWVMWAGAALMTLTWFASSSLPAGVRYDAARQMFSLPGSWVPLGLMMAIFLTKYVVGVMLAMHPALAHDSSIAAIVASLYGAMSGVFLGRMARLLRLAQASAAKPVEAKSVAWG